MAVPYRILMSNIGYAKGISGSLWQHVRHSGRHVYSSQKTQMRSLGQLKKIIDREKPDLCCLIEVDSGSFHSSRYNQLQALINEEYHFYDIADKYGENNPLGKLPLHRGKSNAFISRDVLAFDRLYFTNGSKRLIYQIALPNNQILIFAHFSLNRKVRARQFQELRKLIAETTRETILMGDFNILAGPSELAPLLKDTKLKLLNRPEENTFRFSRYHWMLDLCLCSSLIGEKAELKVIPQPFSDHAALLLTLPQ